MGLVSPHGSTPPESVPPPDVALVRALLQEQHPDLAGLPITGMRQGWDNTLFRLGTELCVRLPHRQLAAELIEHEIRWLPELSPRLPLPVPAPLRVGGPAFGYPWRWTICSWIDGASALAVAPDGDDAAAEELGRFLRALHQPAPAPAPSNPFRGVPLARRDAGVRSQAPAAAGFVDSARLVDRWEQLVAEPRYPGPPLWVHGDVHPGNLIVRDGRLAGVVDFGDLCAGDPAVDFAVGWMMFDLRGRTILRRYCDADPSAWQRAQGWAIAIGLALVSQSPSESEFAELGRRTLLAAVADPSEAPA